MELQEENIEIEVVDSLPEQPPVENEQVSEQPEPVQEKLQHTPGVQKRIDELTYKYRQEEREKALLQQELQQMKQMVQEIQQTQHKSNFERKVEDYASKINAAHMSGDTETAARLNDEYARWVAQSYQQQATPQQAKPQPVNQPQQPAVNPDFIAFQARNEWYGTDEILTAAADAIGRKVAAEFIGQGKTEREAYLEIEKRIKNKFPQEFQTHIPNSGTEGITQQPTVSKNKIVVTRDEIAQARYFHPNKTDDQIKTMIAKAKKRGDW